MWRRWPDDPVQPGRSPDVPRRCRDELRQHPRAAPRPRRRRSAPWHPCGSGRPADALRTRALDRACHLSRRRPNDRGRSWWRDDPRAPRCHRAAPTGGGSRDLHRRPVPRAANAHHDDLRRRPRALSRGQRPRRGHTPRDPRRPRTGTRAPQAAGRGGGEAGRPKRLVEGVVALNRFGEADTALGREPVLLQRIVPHVLASEEERCTGAGFTREVAPGPPRVMAGPTYLEQVVRNLLANAAKYGGQGTAVD